MSLLSFIFKPKVEIKEEMDPDIPDAVTIVSFSALVKKKISVVPKNIMYNPNVKNFKRFSKVFLSIFDSMSIENCSFVCKERGMLRFFKIRIFQQR